MELVIVNQRRLRCVGNSEFEFTHFQVPKFFLSGGSPFIVFAGRIAGLAHCIKAPLFFDADSWVMDLGQAQIVFSPSEKRGTFDDEGVMPGCFLSLNEEVFLFYSGWNSRNTIPYHNSTGLARVDNSASSFVRVYDGPILDRTAEHPYLAVTPTVRRIPGGFEMYYVDGDSWQWCPSSKKYEPIYSIKYAFSDDLMNWSRNRHLSVARDFELECFSNPCFLPSSMHSNAIVFCSRKWSGFRGVRSGGYSLKWASLDDEINSSKPVKLKGARISGVDNEMQGYPEIFSWEGKNWVAYNGNGFGQSGIVMGEVKLC